MLVMCEHTREILLSDRGICYDFFLCVFGGIRNEFKFLRVKVEGVK